MAKKKPLIEPNKWNIVKGSDLIEMGYRKTTDGYLIASTVKYRMWLYPQQIFVNDQSELSNGKKKQPRHIK